MTGICCDSAGLHWAGWAWLPGQLLLSNRVQLSAAARSRQLPWPCTACVKLSEVLGLTEHQAVESVHPRISEIQMYYCEAGSGLQHSGRKNICRKLLQHQPVSQPLGAAGGGDQAPCTPESCFTAKSVNGSHHHLSCPRLGWPGPG